MEFELTAHAKAMLAERDISMAWVEAAINEPTLNWRGDDQNDHYARPIEAFGNRILHVVVNDSAKPKRIVTVFFDRRLRGDL